MKKTTGIPLRHIPEYVLLELNRLASNSNCSREEYIRRLLENHVQSEKLKIHTNQMNERLELNTLAIEQNNELLRQIWLQLDDKKI